MSDLEYYFEGTKRMSWAFDTPNYLGCAIVMVLSAVWGVHAILLSRNKRIAARLTLFVEAGLLAVLMLTYSRGSLVAYAVVSGMGVLLFMRVLDPGWRRELVGTMLLRILLVLGMLYITNFSSRIDVDYLARDNSVLRRFEVWKGALVLLYLRPLEGWGWRESGRSYVDIVQGEGPETVMGVLNSFLQIAVEFGLPWLFVILSVLSVLGVVLVKSVQAGIKDLFFPTTMLTLAAWSLCNMFSTLGESWVINTTVIISLIFACIRSSKLARSQPWFSKQSIVIAAALSATTCIVLPLAGWAISAKDRIKLKHAGDHLQLVVGEPKSSVDLFVDPAVLGPFPIKVVRKALSRSAKDVRVNIPLDRRYRSESDRIVFYGNTHVFSKLCDTATIEYVHPRDYVDWSGFRVGATIWASRRVFEESDVGRLYTDYGLRVVASGSYGTWITTDQLPPFSDGRIH